MVTLPKYILTAWLLESRLLGRCPFEVCWGPENFESHGVVCLANYSGPRCRREARKRYGRKRGKRDGG